MIFLEYWKELCFRSEKYIFFYRIVKYRTRNIDRETIKSIEFDQSDSLLLPYSLYVKEKRKKKERNTFIRYRDTFNSIKVSHNNHLINISKINSELIHILRILKRNRIFIYFCEIVFFFFPPLNVVSSYGIIRTVCLRFSQILSITRVTNTRIKLIH